MKSNEGLLICLTQQNHPTVRSKLSKCEGCGTGIWVPNAERRRYKQVCPQCALPLIEKDLSLPLSMHERAALDVVARHIYRTKIAN